MDSSLEWQSLHRVIDLGGACKVARMETSTFAAAAARRLAWTLGGLTFLVHFALNGRYGFFRDELYFIACGRHLAWGYVDQPPLVAVMARFGELLGGGSLWGFRVPANAAAAACVVLTGLLVTRLGGGRFAVALAAVLVALGPDMLVRGHLLTMNAFEPVLWLALVYVLTYMLRKQDARPWPIVGLLVGVALLNKYSALFLVAGLVLGLLATPQRSLLRSLRLVLAVGLAALLVLPNLLWQAALDWPMLELLRNGQLHKNAPFTLGGFLSQQVLMLGPPAVLASLAGAVWLLRAPQARPFRPLALGLLAVELLFVLGKAKPYYPTALFPPLIAAGAVRLGHIRSALGRAAALTVALVPGLVVAPLAVPVLSAENFIAYQAALGLRAKALERKTMGVLPQHYADQFGWEELVATVSRAWARLSPEQRARTGLYAQNYGEAGALDFFGRRHHLPPALSGHNQYWLWGRSAPAVNELLIVGGDAEDHRSECAHVELLARTPASPYVMPYENALPIWHCLGLRQPLSQLWPFTRHYE